MPRITINVNAPDDATDTDLITLDLPPGLTLADLKGTVEADTNFPAARQTFYLNGQKLSQDSQTLEEAGIKDGEMIGLLVTPGSSTNASSSSQSHQGRQGRPAGSGGGTAGPGSGGPRRRGAPSNDEVENVRRQVLLDPRSFAALREQKPELAAVVNDPAAFRTAWMALYEENEERERERQRNIALLNEDPFNEEAQRKIEEMIRQERVVENLQHAYENNPEVFARVTMLYINAVVNGVPIKAFVDSGAQATIMSPGAATRCGIMRLIDTRFSGIAKGVGTAKILGRVHSAEIKIGNALMPCAFTVMEGKDVDLLLGLDMLKRYQACIDLKAGKLVLGEGNEVPFLGESEIPKEEAEGVASEPSIPGPGGTEIGAKSGAVRLAGGSGTTVAAGPSGSGSGSGLTSGARPQHQQHQQHQHQQQHRPQAPQEEGQQHPPEKIEQLLMLGFQRDEAVMALDATDGDVEMAAGFLFH